MTDLRIRHLLVAVDLGDSCIPALRYTRSLAERFGAGVTVIYADDALTLAGYDEIVAGCEEDPEEPNGLAEAVRRFAARHLGEVTFSVVVSTDDPVHAIASYGRSLNSDLIVMGTHARRGMARMLGGSVAEAVMREADRPVVAVPHTAGSDGGPTITRIVCPVDDSPAARAATRMASVLAGIFGAELYLVHTSPGGETWTVEEDFRAWADGGTEASDFRIHRLHAGRGDRATRLLDCVDDVGADLLVIGATHTKNRTDSVVGRSTERLIRRGRTPLLTVVH